MKRNYLKTKISGILYFQKNVSKLKDVDKIFKQSLNIKYNFNRNDFSGYIFKNKDNAEKILTTKLKNIFFSWQKRYNQESFLSQLISSLSESKYSHKIILPLCNQQIEFVKNQNNLSVNVFKSKTFFIFFIFSNLFKGFLFFLSTTLLSFVKLFYQKSDNKKKVFFDLDLNKKDIFNLNENNSFFVINQFIKKFRIKKEINIFIKPKKFSISNVNFNYNLNKNVSLSYKYNPYPHIRSLVKIIQYFFWSLFSFFICLVSLLRLNWVNSFLFFEATKSKLFNFAESKDTIEIFLCPYNGSLSKSLWQIDCKNKVKRSYLYFYSTNGDGIKTKYGFPNNNSNWADTNFDNYLVWDKYQKKTLLENSNLIKSKISSIGPMLNQTQYRKQNLTLPDNYISVFDITPVRLSSNLTNIFSIITPNYMNKFLKDILDVCQDLDLNMIHKKKKQINTKLLSKKYYNFLNLLEKNKRYLSLENNISVEYLIKNSKLVISFPYTSTSIIAKKLGVPTIYYDPSGLIDINEKNFSHGIDVLNNTADLKNFIKKI